MLLKFSVPLFFFLCLENQIRAEEDKNLYQNIHPFRPNSRIINGSDATPHEAPFMALITTKDYKQCGGSLISPNYILTAGHCLKDNNVDEVLLGAHRIFRREPGWVRIKKFTTRVHEKFKDGYYDKERYRYDLGIIHLAEPVETNENISVVYLPSKGQNSADYVGKTARAYGWGFTRQFPQVEPDSLKYADLNIVSVEQCKKQDEHVYDEDICTAVTNEKMTCKGDSGGPLILDKKLVGITSRGVSFLCKHDSIFVNVAHHLDWIAKNSDVNVTTLYNK